jgi:hypothetical protein
LELLSSTNAYSHFTCQNTIKDTDIKECESKKLEHPEAILYKPLSISLSSIKQIKFSLTILTMPTKMIKVQIGHLVHLQMLH